MEEFVVQQTWKLFLIINQYRKLHTEKLYLKTDTQKSCKKLFMQSHFSLPRLRHCLTPCSADTASTETPFGALLPVSEPWDKALFSFLKNFCLHYYSACTWKKTVASFTGPWACTEYGFLLWHLLNLLLDFATQCSHTGSEAFLHIFFSKRKRLKLLSLCGPVSYPLAPEENMKFKL